jgi:predicted transcriptional regulator
LPALIVSVHSASTSHGVVEAIPKTEAPIPAVSIRKCITPGFLICLDDGKKLKTLKRHLTNLGMTPDQYRTKWNLPKEYPMTAPDYAATRSALAKSIGLGQLQGHCEKETGTDIQGGGGEAASCKEDGGRWPTRSSGCAAGA